MSRKRKPAYSLHKSSGQARVRINGKDHYLGLYGSAESRDRYDDLVREWFEKNGDASRLSLTVDDLALRFLRHAEKYYRKDGQPTGEVSNIRLALRPVVSMFGRLRIREFGPLKLKDVRQEMIDRGIVRTSINRNIGRIKMMFKWAVENELCPVEVYQALATVVGLRAGRSEAKESEPVKPVPMAFIDAVKPFVNRQVWSMIQLQILTGARPGEIVPMRGSDLNMSGRVWEYVPQRHKTEHHGKRRTIYIGPQGQKIIRQFLKPDLTACLFSPRDVMDEFVEANYRPGAAKRRKGTRAPKEQYTTITYGGAIGRACRKADVPHWHPHQLRHNAGTELRREFGIEAARVILDHSSIGMTELYAEQDRAKAAEIIGKIG